MVQWDQQRLGSTGTQVQSPTRHSGLRIRHCQDCGLGRDCRHTHIYILVLMLSSIMVSPKRLGVVPCAVE